MTPPTSGAVLTAAEIAELRREIERETARLERGIESSQESIKPVALDQASVGRATARDA